MNTKIQYSSNRKLAEELAVKIKRTSSPRVRSKYVRELIKLSREDRFERLKEKTSQEPSI